ncbi:MAG: hypothetical protein GF346_04840, partial [Candidatus Eisenbacteria bacterium]|nr:hypothetical protein [Candidatus Eisenbacteria bacterium]
MHHAFTNSRVDQRRIASKLMSALACFLLIAGTAGATSYSWTGDDLPDSRWSRENNWDPMGVPSEEGDEAEILENAPAGDYVIADIPLDIHKVTAELPVQLRSNFAVSAASSFRDLLLGGGTDTPQIWAPGLNITGNCIWERATLVASFNGTYRFTGDTLRVVESTGDHDLYLARFENHGTVIQEAEVRGFEATIANEGNWFSDDNLTDGSLDTILTRFENGGLFRFQGNSGGAETIFVMEPGSEFQSASGTYTLGGLTFLDGGMFTVEDGAKLRFVASSRDAGLYVSGQARVEGAGRLEIDTSGEGYHQIASGGALTLGMSPAGEEDGPAIRGDLFLSGNITNEGHLTWAEGEITSGIDAGRLFNKGDLWIKRDVVQGVELKAELVNEQNGMVNQLITV